MKNLKVLLAEVNNLKTVVFAFGRMNPPTTGHGKLVSKVLALAKEYHGTAVIVLSHSQDPKSNPLTQEQKIKYARAFFPGIKILGSSSDSPNFISQAKKLSDEGYENLIMVAGSDRVDEYKRVLNKYNGKEFEFKKISVESAGERDPDADGAEGMSASKMREYARKGNFNEFKKGVPDNRSRNIAKNMYDDVRKGMTMEEAFKIGSIIYDADKNKGVVVSIRENSIVANMLDTGKMQIFSLSEAVENANSTHLIKINNGTNNGVKTVNENVQKYLKESAAGTSASVDDLRRIYVRAAAEWRTGSENAANPQQWARMCVESYVCSHGVKKSMDLAVESALFGSTASVDPVISDTGASLVRKKKKKLGEEDYDASLAGAPGASGGMNQAAFTIPEEALPDSKAIRAWAMDKETNKLFSERYGADASKKLIEAAQKMYKQEKTKTKAFTKFRAEEGPPVTGYSKQSIDEKK